MTLMHGLPVVHIGIAGWAKAHLRRAHHLTASVACNSGRRHRPRTSDGFSHPTLQLRFVTDRAPRYRDRYAVFAVPLGTDIGSVPGAIVQLVELRVRVESTMLRPAEVRLDVELAVSFRLGR